MAKKVTYIYTLSVDVRMEDHEGENYPVDTAKGIQQSILQALKRIDGDVDIEHIDTDTTTDA